MNPSARPRTRSGHVSETSAAPLAHSPPMPKPRKMRNTASCNADCANPQAAVKIEYNSTLNIRARVRPILSASTPKKMPPAAAAMSVTEPIQPAVVESIRRSRMIDVTTSA